MLRIKTMKKVFIFCLYFLILMTLQSKEKQPDWVSDYRSIYDEKTYLAQKGTGDSAEKSKTDAVGTLARYFQMSVNANLTTTLTSITSGNDISESTHVMDEVKVQSEVQFFALEYTEPWFNKKEKKWYCIAYINRNNAWTQYKPQIDSAKKTFYLLLENSERENDFFLKLRDLKSVWIQGQELLRKLEYGRILTPMDEASYQNERDKISQIPALFEECKGRCSVYIQANHDYNRMISLAISTAFNNCGFRIVKTKEDANYMADIVVDDNMAGENPLSIQPVIDLKVISKTEKTVYSYEANALEKSVGYTLESAQKKAYSKLSKEVEDSVKEHLTRVFKL